MSDRWEQANRRVSERVATDTLTTADVDELIDAYDERLDAICLTPEQSAEFLASADGPEPDWLTRAKERAAISG